MRLVNSARECRTTRMEDIEAWDKSKAFPWYVRLARFLWPKERPVVGMMVSGMRPAVSTTISAGNLYEALYGYEVEA